MARRLTTIARWINEHLPELDARVAGSSYSTDRKIGRLRWPGKGRTGNRIIVTRKRGGAVLLDHNSAETYRSNAEVEEWLAAWVDGRCTRTWCSYGTNHDARCRLVGEKK